MSLHIFLFFLAISSFCLYVFSPKSCSASHLQHILLLPYDVPLTLVIKALYNFLFLLAINKRCLFVISLKSCSVLFSSTHHVFNPYCEYHIFQQLFPPRNNRVQSYKSKNQLGTLSQKDFIQWFQLKKIFLHFNRLFLVPYIKMVGTLHIPTNA